MKILVIGFGVVGRAFLRLLDERRGGLYRRFGLRPRIVGVTDSRGSAVSESGLETEQLLAAKDNHGTVAAVAGHGDTTTSIDALIADSDADLVVEATPSTLSAPQVAINHFKFAFRSGKHAVTVNKAPLAVAMPALFELAAHNRVQFRFSGTVGGGTPILAFARECARGDEIVRIRAILNGTTNFILSRMHASGARFEAALQEAVELGYAESDPSADIGGVDTATKIVILSNWVLGRPATLDDVKRTGIRGIATERIAEAAGRDSRVKLVGEINETLSVGPCEVRAGDPLDVPENLNAVTVTLRTSGDVTLVGPGAGGAETATAVLRDVLDIWRVMGGQA